MKASKLMYDLKAYIEFHGDKEVIIHNSSTGEKMPISELDAFKDGFMIMVDEE